MSHIKSETQVFRIDGKDCFLEVKCDALPIDKIAVGFSSYDMSKPAGRRETGRIVVYLGIFEGQALARDILSGRMTKLAAASRKKAEEAGSKYPESVYTHLGGTSSKNGAKPISRQFKVMPGNVKPWVLEAISGPGKEIGTGLIAPDGRPTTIIRVPVEDAKLKEFAHTLNMTAQIWGFTRFSPVIAPMMEERRERDAAARVAFAVARGHRAAEEDDFPVELPFCN